MKTEEEKPDWMKLMVRPTFTPLFIGPSMRSCEENIPEAIGAGLTYHLWAPSKGGIEWYISKDEYEKVGAAIFKKITEVKDFPEIYKQKCFNASETLVKVAKEVGENDLKNLPSQQLLSFFEKFLDMFCDFSVFLITPHAVDKSLTQKIKEELKRDLKQIEKENLLDEYFNSLMWIEKLPESMQEEEELLQIAKEIEKNQGKITEKINSLIEEHNKKYSWLTTYAYHLEPTNKQIFINRLTKIENATSKIQERKMEYEKRKQEFLKIIEELTPSDEFSRLIKTMQDYIYLRTQRTDMLRKAFFYIQKLIEEIGKRADMTKVEVAYFTVEELRDFLLKGIIPSKREIERRKKHFLIIKKGKGTYELFSKKEEIDEILKEELGKAEEVTAILKGAGVFPGLVKGKVKIIFKPEDARKMEEGDILVTPMTTPSLHSVIIKSGAIVTDEGGITCHAALVSRELHIPCVIGTGKATKVLKGGELVEVNSKKGIITRLEYESRKSKI